jgi:hypothetical protein
MATPEDDRTPGARLATVLAIASCVGAAVLAIALSFLF